MWKRVLISSDAENDTSIETQWVPTGEIWSTQPLKKITSSLWDGDLDVPSTPNLQSKLQRPWLEFRCWVIPHSQSKSAPVPQWGFSSLALYCNQLIQAPSVPPSLHLPSLLGLLFCCQLHTGVIQALWQEGALCRIRQMDTGKGWNSSRCVYAQQRKRTNHSCLSTQGCKKAATKHQIAWLREGASAGLCNGRDISYFS